MARIDGSAVAFHRLGEAAALRFHGSPGQNGIEQMRQEKHLLVRENKFNSGQAILDDARAEAIVCYDWENQLMHAPGNQIANSTYST
jgi:hypothetical protein